MSPIPHDPQSNNFSNRLRAHARLAQNWPSGDNSTPCVWAVDDQLLMTEDVSPFAHGPQSAAAINWFTHNEVNTTLAAKVFDGITKADPTSKDVHVVQVELPDGQDIFWAATELRRALTAAGAPAGSERTVTPNHVLVPAWGGDGCPYGPPTEWWHAVPPPLRGGRHPEPTGPITLLDSGYIWDKSWGHNPLGTLLGHAQASPQPASYPDGGGWSQYAPDKFDADNDGKLDALAGHANFVAGLLAQRCRTTIAIWNHNGSFVGDDLKGVITEASVLRSLRLSQDPPHRTQVVVVTFAYPAFDGVVSSGWDSVLQELREISGNDFVIVCPVGNQGLTERRYPAALALSHPEVIGVASLNADDASIGSDFTNRSRRAVNGEPADPWVTCSAIGEQVASTFLAVNLVTEDDPWRDGEVVSGAGQRQDFRGHHSWALWQGTCFAAPKIAAEIAVEATSSQVNARDAWDLVSARGRDDPNGELGLMFMEL